MSEFKVISVKNDILHLDGAVPLFVKLYEHMKDTGIMMPLVAEGEIKWRNSLEKMIGGRFGELIVALYDDNVVGFAHGIIRYSPEHLGSLKVGYLTHIFVMPEFRGENVGKLLVVELEAWFKTKNVHSFELQVLNDNIAGIGFWEGIGYKKELLQMRKIV